MTRVKRTTDEGNVQNENPGTSANGGGTRKMSRLSKTLVLLTAVIGAFLVWVYAIGYDNTQYERQFSGIEVEITGQKELKQINNYTLAEGQTISSINIVAKGKKAELNQLNESNFRAVVDISSAVRPGEQTFNITVKSPNGIEVVSQSSSTVILFVDEFTQKTVKVSYDMPEYSGTDIKELQYTVSPEYINVKGPRSKIDEIKAGYVKIGFSGEIGDSVDTKTGTGGIELRDESGYTVDNPYFELSETSASYSVTVIRSKTVPVKTAFIGGAFDTGLATSIVQTSGGAEFYSIELTGTASALKAIDELVLNVDETTIESKKTFTISEIQTNLPAGVTDGNDILSKAEVTVTLPKLRSRSYTLSEANVVVTELPEGYDFKVVTKIKITVMGASDAIGDFSADRLTAYIAYDGSGEGVFTAIPRIVIDEAFTGGVYVAGEIPEISFTVFLTEKN